MALPLTDLDKFQLLHALGLPEVRDRVQALLDLAGTGNMTGPVSSTDNAIVRYDGTTGALVQNSGVTITDANNLNGVNNLAISGQATVVGVAATPFVVKSLVGNSAGLKLYADPGTDVASIINHYGAALEFGTNNTVFGSISSTGLWTITDSLNVAGPSAATGTNAPLSFIKVKGTATTDGIAVIGDGVSANMSLAGYGNAVRYKGYRSTGTAAAPGASAAGSLVNLQGYGYNGSAFAQGGGVVIRANSTWSGSNQETGLIFETTPNGSTTVQTSGTISGAGAFVIGAQNGNETHRINGILDIVPQTNLPLSLTGNSSAGTIRFLNPASSGKYNWLIGGQFNVNNVFELTPSTAVDGSSFTTPVFQANGSTGLITIGPSGNTQTHQINGSLNILNSGGPHLNLQDGGTAGTNADPLMYFRDTSQIMGLIGYDNAASLNMKLLNALNGDLVFGANNTNYLTLASTGALILRKDTNGVNRLQIRNDDAGASAFSQLKMTTDSGDFNINVNSAAAGDSVSLTADSTFGGGLDIGIVGSNAVRLNTNGSTRVAISGGGAVTIGTSADVTVEHVFNGHSVLLPRVTTTERDAVTGVNGMIIYNTSTSKIQAYAGGAWVDLH